ncbi:hypothetical protein CLV36_101315 [Laceyella sediminis]|uniref:Uncharacterized protein n=1 Tax=Laceyella sediminis TaxID=573074 RepID=A0ABX5ETB1_9BACL|nr:hypothetical protein [Laceyella sediminis]PRZ17214.1 hypothetical protein CLV36_101315 [Laceyella sediminis]
MKADKDFPVTYQLGKSVIHIVPPQITEEERQRRLSEVKKVIISLLSIRGENKCS